MNSFDVNSIISIATFLVTLFVGYTVNSMAIDIRENRSTILKHIVDKNTHCKGFNHAQLSS